MAIYILFVTSVQTYNFAVLGVHQVHNAVEQIDVELRAEI